MHIIRVNTLSPGAIDTPFINSQFKTEKEADEVKALYASITLLVRIGRPEEIANAVLFLASDESSFSTGTDLIADGGLAQL